MNKKQTLNYNMNKMINVHIGKLIHDELREQGRSVSWFAYKMGTNRSNMYKILKKEDLSTHFLLRASLYLNKNFFLEVSECIKQACVK